MLQPKRTKYRKQFKGRNTGLAMRGNTVAFGDFGLKQRLAQLGQGRAAVLGRCAVEDEPTCANKLPTKAVRFGLQQHL